VELHEEKFETKELVNKVSEHESHAFVAADDPTFSEGDFEAYAMPTRAQRMILVLREERCRQIYQNLIR